MTSTDVSEGNWGERRLVARSRRRSTIRGALVAAAIAFGVFAPKLVPAGPQAAEVKLILSLAYMVVIAIGTAVLWRQADEVERRIAVNSFAAMGVVTLFSGLIVMLAVPVFGIAHPLTTVWVAGLSALGIAYLVQRLRG